MAGRYQLVCPLGRGGMGDLHLARFVGPAGIERLVAVKRLPPQLVANPVAAQALVDEARIAASLSHANIVQVHEVELDDGQVSIIMEFLHGRDVRQILSRLDHPLPQDQAIGIAIAVLAGLHHAHERVGANGLPLGIVHRDMSPPNVLVTFDGMVKVIDFGIARAASRLAADTDRSIVKGKPGYIAPEQIRGEPVDRRADVWGVAALLYEMTLHRPAFDSDDVNAVVEQLAIPPSSLDSDYPQVLEAIVLRGLSRDPAARFDTAADMKHALEVYARKRSLDVSQFGVASLMEAAFRGELADWKAAERNGTTLADHLAAAYVGNAPPSPKSETVPLSAPATRRRWGLIAGVAAGVAVAATALAVVLARGTESASDGSAAPPQNARVDSPPPRVEPPPVVAPAVAPPASPSPSPSPSPSAEGRAASPDPVRSRSRPRDGRVEPPPVGTRPASEPPRLAPAEPAAPVDPDAPLPRSLPNAPGRP